MVQDKENKIMFLTGTLPCIFSPLRVGLLQFFLIIQFKKSTAHYAAQRVLHHFTTAPEISYALILSYQLLDHTELY